MRVSKLLGWVLVAVNAFAEASTSCAGIEALVQRRLPNHAGCFEFSISETSNSTKDSYTVTSTQDGKIHVQGSSTSGVLYG